MVMCIYPVSLSTSGKQRKRWNCTLIHKRRAAIFVPKCQTINAVFYLGIMKRLLARIYRVRAEYREKGNWHLLHENVPDHQLTLKTDFLTKNGILNINHSSYSHDCDMWPSIVMLEDNFVVSFLLLY